MMDDKKLSGLLNTKKELLLRMLDITKKIQGLITQEKTDEINDRLQDRQEIIMLVDVLDQQIKKMDAAGRDMADARKEIEDIVCAIYETDVLNIRMAHESFDSCVTDIRTLNQSKKSAGRYEHAFQDNDGMYFDARK